MARQERAWNAKDLDRYFAGFAPDARFVDRAATSKGGVIAYGASDLATAKAQSRRYFARARFVDRNTVQRIAIAPDGRSARVLGARVTQVETAGRRQTLCARTEQVLVLSAVGLRSRGQTDTAVRCQDLGAARP